MLQRTDVQTLEAIFDMAEFGVSDTTTQLLFREKDRTQISGRIRSFDPVSRSCELSIQGKNGSVCMMRIPYHVRSTSIVYASFNGYLHRPARYIWLIQSHHRMLSKIRILQPHLKDIVCVINSIATRISGTGCGAKACTE